MGKRGISQRTWTIFLVGLCIVYLAVNSFQSYIFQLYFIDGETPVVLQMEAMKYILTFVSRLHMDVISMFAPTGELDYWLSRAVGALLKFVPPGTIALSRLGKEIASGLVFLLVAIPLCFLMARALALVDRKTKPFVSIAVYAAFSIATNFLGWVFFWKFVAGAKNLW